MEKNPSSLIFLSLFLAFIFLREAPPSLLTHSYGNSKLSLETTSFSQANLRAGNSLPAAVWQMPLKKNWYLQSAYLVPTEAAVISSSRFHPHGWLKVEVPTTVLAALVRRGIYPEPTVGMNNLRIPDANEAYNQKYNLAQYSHLPGKYNPWVAPYWFWTRFKLPAKLRGKHLWLHLDGINYRAEIWVNGRLLAGPKEIAGMFGSWRLEITDVAFLNKINTLAVKIYPLDYSGIPAAPQLKTFGSFGENGGPTGDIGKNVTMQCSIGWDWIPEIRDRNMGIWRPVAISATGPVDVRNVMVETKLSFPSPEKEANVEANLTIKAELVNLEKKPTRGLLQMKIIPPASLSRPITFFEQKAMARNAIWLPDSSPRALSSHPALPRINTPEFFLKHPIRTVLPLENPGDQTGMISCLTWQKEIELAAMERREISLDKREWPGLQIRAPRLWWPHDLGFPFLYELELKFIQDGEVADVKKIRFGLREITTLVTEINGWKRRDLFINGRRVFLRGGAWVPEMLLRREADPGWLFKELLLWRHAKLNLVRLWGGGVTPVEDFFEICDYLGLLVWHDFWITGDCQATWGKGSRTWPLEARVFLNNARATVLKLRHHPCLLLWTAGNEGYPREEIYKPLRQEIIAKVDSTRPFLPSSGYAEPPDEWGLSWPDNQPSGSYSGGPYWWIDPKEYYHLAERGRDWLFKNEIGLPSLPLLSSLKKFLPDQTPSPDLPFPLNHGWGFHDACEDNGKYSLYDQAIRRRYGEPRSLDDYVLKAQLVNAENYRAIFEAANQNQEKMAGVILWKTNSAWPSVMWQLYDYYLQPNAAFYFARRAAEPIHPQLDLRDGTVWVVNNQLLPAKNLWLTADLYDLNGGKIWNKQEVIEVAGRRELKLWPVNFRQTSILVLRLLAGREEKMTTRSSWPGDHLGLSQLASKAKAGFLGAGGPEALTYSPERGHLLAENYYWLSPDNNFTALQNLPRIRLQVEMEEIKLPDKDSSAELWPEMPRRGFKIKIHNPTTTIAFFVFFTLFTKKDEIILPCLWDDNFLLLLPRESREVKVRVLAPPLKNKNIYVLLEGWNIYPLIIKVKK
ncbi:MAG: glycoside hydrolase family 2 protein [Candidatus Aminicenantales bacterium]